MRKKLAVIGVGMAVAGVVLVGAAPASALAPHVSVSVSRAFHYADSFGKIQHYNKFTSGKYAYGGWASPGQWSEEAACYTGVAAYDYNFKA